MAVREDLKNISLLWKPGSRLASSPVTGQPDAARIVISYVPGGNDDVADTHFTSSPFSK